MKKIWLFQKDLFDLMLKGLNQFSEEELKIILENVLDLKKITSLELHVLLKQGVRKKSALSLSLAYELGQRKKDNQKLS